MAVEEKPSHLYTHVPTQSVGSINSLPASPTSTNAPHVWASTATRFVLAKKRWLAGIAVYALIVVVAWTRGWYQSGWLRSAFPTARASIALRPGEKLTYDAFGAPSFHPSRGSSEQGADQARTTEAAKTGTTSLGPEADAVYHLSDPSPALYLDTLERFVIEHFPARDADPTDPDSIISTLRSFFPSPSGPPVNASIPHAVYMTAAMQYDLVQKEPKIRTWTDKNPGWAMRTQDDEQADAWVRRRFTLNGEAGTTDHQGTTSAIKDGVEEKKRGIVAAWDRLAEPAVLRSDFWRYLVLAVDGGVYSDTDVIPIRPVEKWGEDPEWYGSRPEGYVEPSLIVGVEADVGNRHDWHDWWPRPLQISQWTMASARGHPVMLDTVRRVVEMALEDESAETRSVMERTGPGPFTDAVLSYLLVQYRKPWGDLRGLNGNGWRFRASRDAPDLLRASRYGGSLPERWGDTKVLSITGFSPGVGHMGAQDVNDPAAMAVHGFAGSWRNQKGADI